MWVSFSSILMYSLEGVQIWRASSAPFTENIRRIQENFMHSVRRWQIRLQHQVLLPVVRNRLLYMECWPWLSSFSLCCGTYLWLLGLDRDTIVRDMVIRQHLRQSKLLWQWNGLLLRLSRTLVKKLLFSVTEGLLLLIYRFWYLDMLMGHTTCPIPSQCSSQYTFLCNFIMYLRSILFSAMYLSDCLRRFLSLCMSGLLPALFLSLCGDRGVGLIRVTW